MNLYHTDWIEIDGNHIHPTAIIYPNVKLGTGNWIGAYTVIGSNGEIRGKDQKEFQGNVSIGDNNVISEHVTIQRPFEFRTTYIGNDNLIMAHSHIGHDVKILDNFELCTGANTGGYTIIKSGVNVRQGATLRNRLTIEENALIGLGSSVVKDVKEGSIVYGNPAKPRTQ